MAITQKQISDVTSGIRSVYQKATDVLRKNEVEYGIELLKGVVQADPGFMDARKALRDAERKKAEKMGGFAKFLAQLKTGKFVIKAKSAISKQPVEAMKLAEEALAIYLYLPSALNALADAAKAADATFITEEALTILLDMNPEGEAEMERLAEFYTQIGDGKNTLRMRQMLLNKAPSNMERQAKVREAAAQATINEGQWDKKERSVSEVAKPGSGAEDVGDRIIRAEDDIRESIRILEEKRAAGDDSLDVLRRLADLYVRDNRHTDAINIYNVITEKMGTLDPSVDKAIERSTVAIRKGEVEKARAAGASAEEIDKMTADIYAYRIGRYEDRIHQYPNDLFLRFEFAEILWETNQIDRALEQFQLSQRNPQKRLDSIVYLGRCFHAKGQNDMAVEQFRSALSEMSMMDKEKMNATYQLGLTYEDMGKQQEAVDCFRQIYVVNVNYLDVSARIDAATRK